jgi:hypothetical protein
VTLMRLRNGPRRHYGRHFRGTAHRVFYCQTATASSVLVSPSRWRNWGWRKCWERPECRRRVASPGAVETFGGPASSARSPN